MIDSYQRPLPNTYIRWVRMEENREAGAPIDVEATADGYFTSEIGIKDLGYVGNSYLRDFPGCPPLPQT